MSADSLEALREWYQANKDTPECRLALKHRQAMAPGVAEELKKRAPGDTDEERELGLIFAMTQIAEKLEMHAVLLAGIRVEHLPAADTRVTEHVDVAPEYVPAAHVDVTPLRLPDFETLDEPADAVSSGKDKPRKR